MKETSIFFRFRDKLYLLGGMVLFICFLCSFGVNLDVHLPNKEEICREISNEIKEDQVRQREAEEQLRSERNWYDKYGVHNFIDSGNSRSSDTFSGRDRD